MYQSFLFFLWLKLSHNMKRSLCLVVKSELLQLLGKMLMLVIKVWFNHMIKNMSNIDDFNALSLEINVYISGGRIALSNCTSPYCFFICTCNEFKATQDYQSWQSYTSTTPSTVDHIRCKKDDRDRTMQQSKIEVPRDVRNSKGP